MVNNVFSPAAEAFVNVVSNFGCISIRQSEELFGERAKRIASVLITKNIIKEREGVYVSIVNPVPDRLMVDCLWVAMSKVKDENGEYNIEQLNLAIQNKPVYIGLISNNTFYNIVGITADNLASSVAFLVDRFNKNNETENGIEYIFVVRNENLIDEILEMKPKLPYRIVLLQGEGNEMPKIRYLKKQ